jgi:hypothetical protein
LVLVQVTTIRLRLLEIGAVILRNTRRIRFLLSSSYPDLHSALQLATDRHLIMKESR